MATAIQASPTSWRGKRARQYLFPFPHGWDKEQGGPRHGEAVAVVGFDRHDAGFEIAYIRSYAPGEGHARLVYEWLKSQHGRLTATERRPAVRIQDGRRPSHPSPILKTLLPPRSPQ